jgi:phosphoribosyl 1,2-cyclic phosphodiesterase
MQTSKPLQLKPLQHLQLPSAAVSCRRDSTMRLPGPLPACLQSPYRHWFLTHFHADHYKGLTGK